VLVRPDRRDLGLIGLYVGRIVTGLGLVMLVPISVGVLRAEWDDALDFVIGAALAIAVGQVAEWRLSTRRPLGWDHAMPVVALSWLACAFFAAVPLFLSGHYGGFLDAYFDAMSGLATAGLGMINDLDHLSDSVNLWRHMTQFLGGQGLVLAALSLFGGGGGLTGLYVGEGREDRILPNVVGTAKVIWRIALLYGLLGTMALWTALLVAGMPVVDGLLHAVMLFMAAFDTGGFAPTAASLGFYHSALVEGVASVLMVAGMLSFALHHLLWQGRLGALVRSSEVRVIAFSILSLTAISLLALARVGAYDSAEALFRRGFFTVLSAHTGTGFATVPGRQLVTDWGALAPAMIVVAMALGGMAGSTAGGIKGLRLALVLKGLHRDVQKLSLPNDAVIVERYWVNGARRTVQEAAVRGAALITLLYVLLYLVGALVGMFYGYTLQEALFESTSAAAAVGLSVGVVGPNLETGFKLVLIAQMWVGRLEFLAVFALATYWIAMLRGRR
jgi:trk system potassium uptake protein